MCGIAALYLKDPSLERDLGRHLAGMMEALSDRGPDSAGVAIFGADEPGFYKITVSAPTEDELFSLEDVLGHLTAGIRIQMRSNHAIIRLPVANVKKATELIETRCPIVTIVSMGRRMELFKDVGRPETVTQRYGLAEMAGTHGIGHTRMATESAVTTAGSHPFSTGPDQCLVHNGSLSNHHALQRVLTHNGLTFRTDNDSEVAAGYLTWRMSQGERLDQALTHSLADLDGFYTFVVGTEDSIGVLRDPIACKPAIMAETDQYVAFGTEYRALVDLPGITNAEVWEPKPATPYFWNKAS